MTLKGKKPEAVEKRLKALFYGGAGVGKTMASIQFPRPYLIDTERGAENAQYTDMLKKQGGLIFQTTDFDELLQEVKSLLTEKHEYKTLIIDPLTTVYNSMLDQAALKVGTEFGRHYGEANKHMKNLLNMLLRLDMNVIITTHAKNEYGDNLSILGQTFDCYKKLDYLFDLVIEIKKHGSKRLAIIKKSRIKTLQESESFPFSYQAIAEKYGKDILEKESITQKLASEEQIYQLKELIDSLKVPEEIVSKFLDKAQASSFEELEESKIVSWINTYKEK